MLENVYFVVVFLQLLLSEFGNIYYKVFVFGGGGVIWRYCR